MLEGLCQLRTGECNSREEASKARFWGWSGTPLENSKKIYHTSVVQIYVQKLKYVHAHVYHVPHMALIETDEYSEKKARKSRSYLVGFARSVKQWFFWIVRYSTV